MTQFLFKLLFTFIIDVLHKLFNTSSEFVFQ